MVEPAKSSPSDAKAGQMPPPDASSSIASPAAPAAGLVAGATAPLSPRSSIFALRRAIPIWAQAVLGIVCVSLCLLVWWWVTRGDYEDRIVSSIYFPSPRETFEAFPSLWFDQALTRNTMTTLGRLILGFGLAAVIGVPLGVLCGCFSWLNAFFLPVN